MDWLGITELVALTLVVLLLVPVVFLGARRRWLSRQGGLFDCSLRLSTSTPGTGWVLGVARYSGDNLEWFRAFSLSLRPRLIFPRSKASAGLQREPDPIESVLLYDDQRIVRMELDDGRSWELAMAVASLTGLLSWLESAPPGSRYR
ncbi:MAG: DUF2550 domain-containing protein [Propionibacteriaceae bacterium]|nr:DUF2550 domain-containing protein [Propionibacteriaceae bacterium]